MTSPNGSNPHSASENSELLSIITGYEVYDSKGMIDIEASIKKIQEAMFARNPEKYGDFLQTLNKTRSALYAMYHPIEYFRKWVIKQKEDTLIENYLELFKYVYYAMRLIDDIVDGDTPESISTEQKKQILDAIISGNIETIANPLLQTLYRKIEELSQHVPQGNRMSGALNEIVSSMLFDFKRSVDTESKLRSREELETNFHMMDITGTIAGTAIIFGIKIDSILKAAAPLGNACRIMYNIRDLGEDIIAGLINIPKEDLQELEISDEDIEGVKEIVGEEKLVTYEKLPPSIKKWIITETLRIDKCMENHKENMKQSCDFVDNPGWLMKAWRNFVIKKMIFPTAYENEIKKRTQTILGQVLPSSKI